MKLNVNELNLKASKAIAELPLQNVISFTSDAQRIAYATGRAAGSGLRGEHAEMYAIALLDVVRYYPRQSGKEYGDMELADGDMVQVKTDGGKLGSREGTAQDRLVRAYEAIDTDACDWYLLVTKDNKGRVAVTKEELKMALPELFKGNGTDLRLTINEKRLRACFRTDYQRA